MHFLVVYFLITVERHVDILATLLWDPFQCDLVYT